LKTLGWYNCKKYGLTAFKLKSTTITVALCMMSAVCADASSSTTGTGNKTVKGGTEKAGSVRGKKESARHNKTSTAAKAKADAKSDTAAVAATPAYDEQFRQLNEKVQKLGAMLEEQQQKADEKISRLETIIDQQQRAMSAMQTRQGQPDVAREAVAGSPANRPASESSDRLSNRLGGNSNGTGKADSGTGLLAANSPHDPAASPNSTAPASAPAPPVNSPAPTTGPAKTDPQEGEAPLSLKIGSAYVTPYGFADFMTVFRSTNVGNGLPTNFGGIPFSNTTAGQLSEIRPSAQGSRLGTRIDANVGSAHVIGVVEFDFLGFVPTNAAVVYNNSAPRLRLAFVDVRKNKFEVLGGQAWSLISPGRNGLSPLPEDVYYPHLDPDNQLGLTWNRVPQFRFIYHASKAVTMGFSVEEPEQYIGGFGGAGTITFPSALAAAYAPELNNGATTLNTPNVAPDFVAKVAFDPMVGDRHLHIELVGLERNFRVFNPITKDHFEATGGGGSINLCLELLKNLRVISYNYYNDGGGRYIFGQAPDLVVRGDGSISLVHSASTVEGLELQAAKKTLLYAYYGGVYIEKNAVVDPVTHAFVGYGFPGSSTAQNRELQEPTFGLMQTLWKDPRFGQLQLGLQYSYVTRSPWVAPATGPKTASTNMFYVDLRYSLPGSAPKLPY